MNSYNRLAHIERQVYISFDGEGGLIIQTDIATYYSYYKLLGWHLLGRAVPLPVITEAVTPHNRQSELF